MAYYTEPTIDEMYVDWLHRMIDTSHSGNTMYNHSPQTYSKLIEAMYRSEFTPLVDFDQNREADGLALRDQFLFETDFPSTGDFLEAPCSILEMVIGISSRMSFNMDLPLSTVFWRLVRNLDLTSETDEYFDEERVFEVLERLNYREYDELGNGGLFPLTESNRDQRTLEIMYQMYEYVSQVYG